MVPRLKIRLFAIFTIILLCISMTIKSLQNDTFYIIKLGGDILNYGIDLIDHYSWVANLSYTYPHWLYDLLMYLIYSNFDFLGIYVSTMLLFIILILSIYIVNLMVNKNELMAAIIAVVSIPCLVGFASARSQLITGILFLWQIYFIERLINSGKKRYVFFLTLISLFVANLHATIWPFYFILYLPFIGEEFVNKLLSYKKRRKTKSLKLIIGEVNNFKLLIVSFILGFFMGFLSPTRICFTYIFKIMLGNSQEYIMEHASMILCDNLSFLCFSLVLLVILIFSSTKIKLRELFVLGGLIFMSLSSVRHVALFYIIGLLYMSILGNRYLLENKDTTLDVLGNMFVKNKYIYSFGYIIIIIVSFYKFQYNISLDYVPKEIYPVEAVKFIDKNLDLQNIRLYNDYNFGSYLLFNDIPVFVDSRCDLYLKEFNSFDYSIFDDAVNIVYDYEEKFEFYGVTHALVANNSLLNRLLEKDNNFKVLYSDKYFTLHEVEDYEI